MKNVSVLGTVSGVLVAASLLLAGPALAEEGHAPAAPAAPAAHAAQGSIGENGVPDWIESSHAAVGSGGEQPFGPIGAGL